jgi:hypothetical protein
MRFAAESRRGGRPRRTTRYRQWTVRAAQSNSSLDSHAASIRHSCRYGGINLSSSAQIRYARQAVKKPVVNPLDEVPYPITAEELPTSWAASARRDGRCHVRLLPASFPARGCAQRTFCGAGEAATFARWQWLRPTQPRSSPSRKAVSSILPSWCQCCVPASGGPVVLAGVIR